jgi:cilla- and flagella-associated protein
MLLSKCKTDKLSTITNVNFWGNDIEDLSLIATELPNVEIVSLSINKISTLKDFQGCFKLKELYLRKNNISDLREVQYLTKLPQLQTLWLSHNPCSEHPYYRLYVIRMLPGLSKLDNADIT